MREWELRRRALARIDEIFALVIDSAFFGARKPEPEIYELAVTRLGVRADECLFVDDVEVDCEGAVAAGMQAAVFRDTEQAIAELLSFVSRIPDCDQFIRNASRNSRVAGAAASPAWRPPAGIQFGRVNRDAGEAARSARAPARVSSAQGPIIGAAHRSVEPWAQADATGPTRSRARCRHPSGSGARPATPSASR